MTWWSTLKLPGQDVVAAASMPSSTTFFPWDKKRFCLMGGHGLISLPFAFKLFLWSQGRIKKGDTEQDPLFEWF